MNSAQIIVERAKEKRIQNPDYQLSLEELRAVDAVLIAQARARAFDFGTSPHGLSADLRPSQPEKRERSSSPPSAKPVLTFSFTEEQRSALSFAALCEAEDLAAGREAHEPEVQEAICRLWEARSILEEVPA